MNNKLDIMISSLPFLLEGALNTIFLSIVSIIGALVAGLIIALFRISDNRILVGFARYYVSFFRGTPLLIQLLIFYNGITSFGIILTGWQAAIIGLILHFGAYISESMRAAILSLPKGQWEAAMSLGMDKKQALRYIIIPQAWQQAIPPVWNSLIDLVKASSLAAVITVPELTMQADQISAATLVVLPILLEAAAIYWIFTTILNVIQDKLEKRFRRRVGI